MTRARKADLRTASQNLLTVEVTDLPEPTVLQGRLDRINHELGSPSMRVLHHRKLPLMCEELAVPRSGSAVSVGLTHSRLVVAAHHEHVDESGMLEVLGRLSGHPISSKLDPRAPLPASSAKSGPSPGPSPGLAPSHYRNDLLSDVFASIRLRGRVHIARVMSAGARATRRYNARRVAAQVNQSRELSPLMFATVGLVELPRSVRSLELYPAPRTSFDVAIGTCTEDDQTIVTARSRASQHTVADLQELLELLRNELLWGRLRDQSD